MRLAVVAARFNDSTTDRMVARALDRARERNVRVTTVVRVPGTFEIPLAVRTLLARDDVDAAVALAALIKGETQHDEALMAAVGPALLEIGLRAGKPVGLGITGPGMTEGQAVARIDRAARAVDAAIAMVELMKGL
ncbi:MAG: 6,7-dimethyl-8-ribityllumazine synthase [Methanobacteriota archaeon]